MGYEWITVVPARLTGIEPHEVMQVLAAPARWPRPAVDDVGIRVLTVWGRTRTGRALMIAPRHQGPRGRLGLVDRGGPGAGPGRAGAPAGMGGPP